MIDPLKDGTLQEWSKEVRIEMIRRDWKYKDLAKAAGISVSHLTAVVNVKSISPNATAKISKALEIDNPYDPTEKIVS